MHIPHYAGAVMTVSLDGEKRGVIAYPPYTLQIEKVAPGEHTLTVDLFISRHNGFGSVHNADEKHSWEGPDAWRTEGDGWTESYRLKREGVLSAPVVSEE